MNQYRIYIQRNGQLSKLDRIPKRLKEKGVRFDYKDLNIALESIKNLWNEGLHSQYVLIDYGTSQNQGNGTIIALNMKDIGQL